MSDWSRCRFVLCVSVPMISRKRLSDSDEVEDMVIFGTSCCSLVCDVVVWDCKLRVGPH
jgi:hypothetical protein